MALLRHDKTKSLYLYFAINRDFFLTPDLESVKQTKTYPGADTGSDHNPVVVTVKINLKRIKKKESMEQFNMDMHKGI